MDGAVDAVVPEQAARTIAKDAAMTAYFGNHLGDRDMLCDSSSVPRLPGR